MPFFGDPTAFVVLSGLPEQTHDKDPKRTDPFEASTGNSLTNG